MRYFCVLMMMGAAAQAEVVVRGTVRDVVTGLPLPGANIEVVGTGRGTFVDAQGNFLLRAESRPLTLRVTHVGYASVEVEVEAASVKIALQPAPYEMDVVEIEGRDPAYAIMQQVILRKAERDTLVPNWRVEVYTRQTLYGTNEVLAVRESASELFWARDEGVRELLVARRASTNVPDSLSVFPAAAYLFDLYADQVEILGQKFPGPVGSQTFRLYRFQLVRREGDLYHIAVQPRRDRPALSGSLVVSDGDFALVEARLRPNRRLYHPYYESAMGLGYVLEQRFDRIEPGVWLPVLASYEIEGVMGSSARERGRLKGEARYVRREIVAAVAAYAFLGDREMILGPPSPTWDKLLARELPPVHHDQEASESDSTRRPFGDCPQSALFRLHEHLPDDDVAVSIAADPLAEESMVSDEAIKGLITHATGIAADPVQGKFTSEVWANRVDALHLGLRWRGESLRGERLGLYLKGGYDTGPRRPFYAAGGRKAWGKESRQYAGLFYQAQTRSRYPSSLYSLADNSYPFLWDMTTTSTSIAPKV